MDYKTPASYKNYLPGKKIQIVIGLLVLAGVAYAAVPPLVSKLKSGSVTIGTKNSGITIGAPEGDPTTRDSDGDTIPDWQEIAVGLDPHAKESTKGTPDVQTLEKLKSAIGHEIFEQETSLATDTDKLSLTIYNDIATTSAAAGETTQISVSEATGQEILNYIAAQEKKNATFALKDLQLVESTLANNQSYYAIIKPFLADDPATDDFPQKVQDYLNGAIPKSELSKGFAYLQKAITAMKTMDVPTPAGQIHLNILNDTQGLYQTLNEVDPKTEDEIAQISSLSLVQDYIMKLTKSAGELAIYFSVALNSSAYTP